MQAYKKHPLYKEELSLIANAKGMEGLSGKSVMIIGATGLIGSQITDALMMLNYEGLDIDVTVIGRSEETAEKRLGEHFGKENFRFFSLLEDEDIHPALEADYIIPLASLTHPVAYSRCPIETMKVNLRTAERALDCAARCNGTVIYPSTVEIYGNATDNEPFKETATGMLDLSTSRACYTESKRACEAMCLSYMSERGVNVKIARLCRVFGAGVLPDDSKASSQFLRKAKAGEDIVLKSEGSQFFSYIYCADAVSALFHIMLKGQNGTAYNVSNDACNVSLRDFAQACADAAGTKVAFDLPDDTERKGYSVATRAVLDNSRLLALGWQPRYDLKEAIRRTIQISAFSEEQNS